MLIDEKNNLASGNQRFAKDDFLGFSLGNGEFLINTMWIDEKSKRHNRLCHEMLGIDATFRTIAENVCCAGDAVDPSIWENFQTNMHAFYLIKREFF